MPSKPLVSALALTVIAAIPLTLLSAAEFTLNWRTLPLAMMTLFILLLTGAYWPVRYLKSDIQPMSDPAGLTRETGNVKWFNPSKGFGFITRDTGDDVFVHFRAIRGQGHRVLRDGQRVEFIVTRSEKGLQAEDVAVARR